MRTENQVRIRAPLPQVFDLGADIERWPVILPHYRYVRVLGGASGREPLPSERTVEMCATRSGIPVRWTSTQWIAPADARVSYRHVRGFTRGMDVVWEFAEEGKHTDVRIVHDLDSPRGLLRLPGGTRIAETVFVTHIADRTLAGIKAAAEHARAEGRAR